MRTLIVAHFESAHEMAGAMPGEPLYLSARGVTTRFITGRQCGTYHSHEGHYVKLWSTLTIKGPCFLFRTTA